MHCQIPCVMVENEVLPVVTRSQCAEAFLTGSIPNGKFHFNAVNDHGFRFEVDADGERLIGIEVVLGKT